MSLNYNLYIFHVGVQCAVCSGTRQFGLPCPSSQSTSRSPAYTSLVDGVEPSLSVLLTGSTKVGGGFIQLCQCGPISRGIPTLRSSRKFCLSPESWEYTCLSWKNKKAHASHLSIYKYSTRALFSSGTISDNCGGSILGWPPIRSVLRQALQSCKTIPTRLASTKWVFDIIFDEQSRPSSTFKMTSP